MGRCALCVWGGLYDDGAGGGERKGGGVGLECECEKGAGRGVKKGDAGPGSALLRPYVSKARRAPQGVGFFGMP